MTRHRTDPLSLLFGLAFIGVAVAAWSGVIRLDTAIELRWVWPVLLIGGGLTLLAGITRRGDAPTSGRADAEGPDDGSSGDPAEGAGWESPSADG